MGTILYLAIFLIILWVVLRVALALTWVFLNLLWVVAVVLIVLWLVDKIRAGLQK